ncbi:MAG: DUF3334 family protein [Nitrospinae bacterium]|nr:DUF3334 family protein [Nitrospinota bacterium]
MKAIKFNTMNEISKIMCEATKIVVDTSSGTKVKFSPTVQKIPGIYLKPDIGCFVQFDGDYSGILILNFSGAAALELYRESMVFMGIPEEDLAKDYYHDDVVNSIGELVNQVVGKIRGIIERTFGLSARNNQPKAITITSAINLTIDTHLVKPRCRKLSFKTAENNPFYIEFSLEDSEFIQLFAHENIEEELDIEAIMNQANN